MQDIYKGAVEHRTFLDWWDLRSDETERQWFLQKYYPDYDLIIACLYDLLAWQPLETDFSGTNMRVKNHEQRQYTTAEIAERHGTTSRWVQTNVFALVEGFTDESGERDFRMRAAGSAYAVDIANRHPRLPWSVVADMVHEFVPPAIFSLNYLREFVVGRYHRELSTPARNLSARRLMHLRKRPNVTEQDIEDFIDECLSD